MPHVLIATDGSEGAASAVEIGLDLAMQRQADVTFLHVSAMAAEELFALDPVHPPSDRLVAAADPALRAAAEAAVDRGVRHQLRLIGPSSSWAGATEIAAEIEGVADAVSADLIIVGCRGRERLTVAVLGSVSQALLARSGHSVVVVGRPPVPG